MTINGRPVCNPPGEAQPPTDKKPPADAGGEGDAVGSGRLTPHQREQCESRVNFHDYHDCFTPFCQPLRRAEVILKFPRYAGHLYVLLLMLFHGLRQSCRNRHDGLPLLTSIRLDIIVHYAGAATPLSCRVFIRLVNDYG